MRALLRAVAVAVVICENCGATMRMTGMGTRVVRGEPEAVHTTSYRCESCGHSDFSPKMYADLHPEVVCEFCGEEVTPGAPGIAYAISGWEYQRKGGGANVIHLRKRLDRYAHEECIEDAKPRKREREREREPKLDLSQRFAAAGEYANGLRGGGTA